MVVNTKHGRRKHEFSSADVSPEQVTAEIKAQQHFGTRLSWFNFQHKKTPVLKDLEGNTCLTLNHLQLLESWGEMWVEQAWRKLNVWFSH